MDATSGEVVDYDHIRTRMNERNQRYRISQVAIDRWNATQLANQLAGDGFEMISFGQGYASKCSSTKKLEDVVLANQLRHGGHPVLRWMAGNASIEQDAADNWTLCKKKSCERIDGVVALITALDLASRVVESLSVYSTYGNLALAHRTSKSAPDLPQKLVPVAQMAIGRWNTIQLSNQLAEDGFEMVSFGQGYASMSAPNKKFEEVLLAERLRHSSHAVLRWMEMC